MTNLKNICLNIQNNNVKSLFKNKNVIKNKIKNILHKIVCSKISHFKNKDQFIYIFNNLSHIEKEKYIKLLIMKQVSIYFNEYALHQPILQK